MWIACIDFFSNFFFSFATVGALGWISAPLITLEYLQERAENNFLANELRF